MDAGCDVGACFGCEGRGAGLWILLALPQCWLSFNSRQLHNRLFATPAMCMRNLYKPVYVTAEMFALSACNAFQPALERGGEREREREGGALSHQNYHHTHNNEL